MPAKKMRKWFPDMWHHGNDDPDEEEVVDHHEDAVDGGGAEDPPPTEPPTELQAELQPLADGRHATTSPNTPTASDESWLGTQFRMHREGARY